METFLTEIPKGAKLFNPLGNENSDRIFYRIWRKPPGAGFFSNFLHVIGHLLIADKNDYIPVIDMEVFKTIYNVSDKVNDSENAWEYYFEQPLNFTLKDISLSKHVILSSGEGNPEMNYSSTLLISEDAELLKVVNYLINKYIRIRPEITKSVNDFVINNFFGKKVLGVHARGTDMRSGIYKDHRISAGPVEIIDRTLYLFNKHNFDLVFLSTEDEDYLNKYKLVFKDKLIFTDCFRANAPGWSYGNTRLNHNYFLGKEVLVDMLLLSNCSSLLCGISNVSATAISFCNNNYEFVDFILDEN